MNLPNKITTFRMAMVGIIVFILLFPFAKLGFEFPTVAFANVGLMQFIAFWLFLIASFSDFLDGFIARKYNLVTNYGKFMDPIADKLLVNSVLIIFTVPSLSLLTKSTAVPVIVTVIMIARDIIVDALRLLAMEKKQVIPASRFGKAKTVCQMIALSLVLLNNWPFSILGWNFNVTILICYIAGGVSLASGIDYLIKGKSVFKDNPKPTKKILAKLQEQGLTIGTIESLTGGLLGASFSEVSGASKVYRGSITTYATEIKHKLAEVKPATIQKHGVVSEAVAAEMAKNGLKILDVDFCLALTGNAGPEVLDDLAVGTVYLAIATNNEVKTYKLNITKTERNAIREECVEETLRILNEEYFKEDVSPKPDKIKIINKIDNKIIKENTIVRYVLLIVTFLLILFPYKYYTKTIMQMTSFGLDIPMIKLIVALLILVLIISSAIDFFLLSPQKEHARMQVSYIIRFLVYGGWLFSVVFNLGFSAQSTGIPILALIIFVGAEVARFVIFRNRYFAHLIYYYLSAASILVFVSLNNWPFSFLTDGVNITGILVYLLALGGVGILIYDTMNKTKKTSANEEMKKMLTKINTPKKEEKTDNLLGK